MTALTLLFRNPAVRNMGGALGRLDRVASVTLGIFVLLAFTVPDQARASFLATIDNLLFIAPFLALSVAIAAGCKATSLDQQIARVFKGNQTKVIVMAATFGALSPFCSCGVIPLIAALLAAGVPLAPVMAFWIASPIMDPEMFILTTAVLGPDFAIAKTVIALVMGMGAGFGTHFLVANGAFPSPLRGAALGGCGTQSVSPSDCGTTSLTDVPKVAWKFWREEDRLNEFRSEGMRSGWFLFKWLTFAFVIESLMIAYIPAETVGGWLGGDQWWSIPISVLVGVPTYLNGYAAIPTISGLMDLGMGPGPAMAFMIAGSVTCIPAAIAVYALVKNQVFILFLIFALAGSTVAGFAFQAYMAV